MRALVWGVLLVAATLAAGCAAGPQAEPQAGPTPTQGDAGGREATFPETILVYEREGRFPGSPAKWTFYQSGRVVTGDGAELSFPAETVSPLFELVASEAFAGVAGRYAPEGTCEDCTLHTLTVFGEGEPREVVVTEGATAVPAVLQELLSGLEVLISQ